MLWFALHFLLGNLLLQCREQLPVWQPWWLAVPVVVASLLYQKRHSARRTSMPGSVALFAMTLGFGCAWLHAGNLLHDDLMPALEGQDLVITGHVSELPEAESYGQRFRFTIAQAPHGVPPQLQLTWYAPAHPVQASERWQLVVRLRQRHGFANPGGQDYALQLMRQGIGATGYVRDDARNQLQGRKPHQWILSARAAVVARIEQALPQHAMQGVARGLAVGDQQAISNDQWQVFARTGVSHLMAISGFHIGMVAWLFAWLGKLLLWLPMAQRWQVTAPKLRAVFGMSGALGYSLLAGMSVPTQRTLIMLAVYFTAVWLRRAVNVWHGFGVALLLVLLADPLAPLSVGAWLSFGSVAIILLNQHGRLGVGSQWRNFIKLQAMVTIGLVPLSLACFGNLSLVAPLVNLLAIPWFSLVLAPLVLVGCALSFVAVSPGAAWLQGVAWLLQHTVITLHAIAALPWSVYYWPALPIWALTCIAVGSVMMVIPWHGGLRLLGALLCVPLCWQPARLPAGALRMTTLDVGQGLAVVMQTRNHVLVYDAGPVFQSGRDTGELVLLPYLRAAGIRHLDVLLASHGDADHVGGIHTVLHNMQVKQFMRGPSVPVTTAHDVLCQQGMSWRWDEVTFTVLHPDLAHLEASDNNQSCVLHVQSAGGSVLLMGDAERRVEETLLAKKLIGPTSIVEAGHHGSRSSSSLPFVSATQSKYVVFSAGYRNRWGFPKPEVTARWQAVGAQMLSTIDAGAVTMELLPTHEVQIQRHRQTHRHYWLPMAAETTPGPPLPGSIPRQNANADR